MLVAALEKEVGYFWAESATSEARSSAGTEMAIIPAVS